jgi:hypothetical protein
MRRKEIYLSLRIDRPNRYTCIHHVYIRLPFDDRENWQPMISLKCFRMAIVVEILDKQLHPRYAPINLDATPGLSLEEISPTCMLPSPYVDRFPRWFLECSLPRYLLTFVSASSFSSEHFLDSHTISQANVLTSLRLKCVALIHHRSGLRASHRQISVAAFVTCTFCGAAPGLTATFPEHQTLSAPSPTPRHHRPPHCFTHG